MGFGLEVRFAVLWSKFTMFMKNEWLVVAASTFLLFCWTILKSAGLHPIVMADEWIYSSSSRLMPLSEARLPSYLFLATYKFTNLCGPGFLDCVRIINSIFFIASFPVIYVVARKYATAGISLAISFTAILGPISYYSAYFMPEVMYFFCFWILVWLVLNARHTFSLKLNLVIGGWLGLAMLVKFHALFLLGGYILYLTLTLVGMRSLVSVRKFIFAAAGVIISCFVVRFALGFLFAGPAGLSITGSFYSGYASSAVDIERLLYLLPQVIGLFWVHLAVVSLLYLFPSAVMVNFLLLQVFKGAEGRSERRCALFCLCVLLATISATALFTASAAGTGMLETVERIHLRYYSFVFPLLAIATAASLRAKNSSLLKFFSISIVLVVLLSFWMVEPDIVISFIDNPELRGLFANENFKLVFIGFSLIVLFGWLLSKENAVRLYFYLVAPFFAIFGSYFVGEDVRNNLRPNVYDEAGSFVKNFLKKESGSLAVASDFDPGIYRAMFHIDNASVLPISISAAQAILPGLVPRDRSWLLLFGDHKIDMPVDRKIQMNGYALYRLDRERVIDFTVDNSPALQKAEGLSHVEDFGRWSNGKTVDITLTDELLGEKIVKITAAAFGPNIGKSFELIHAYGKHHFELRGDMSSVCVKLKLPAPVSKLTIVVPNPTSPAEVSASDDERRLGVAIKKIVILNSKLPTCG
ncbi:DUF7024 domain-containing protein [Stutzerimonas chloritidismutans]|uniref:DUF7024 domain-containing protein n=1 Tax=Stutzerimonas chloritidismutans TaxID=203192 RepID=UPI00384E660F